MNKQQIPLKNSLFLLLAAIIWGIAFVAQSVGMKYVGGFTFSAVRSLIGAAVLLPLIFILGRKEASADSSSSSSASRKDLIIDIQQDIMDDAATVFFGYETTYLFSNKKVTGVKMYPMDYYWLTKDITLAE